MLSGGAPPRRRRAVDTSHPRVPPTQEGRPPEVDAWWRVMWHRHEKVCVRVRRVAGGRFAEATEPHRLTHELHPQRGTFVRIAPRSNAQLTHALTGPASAACRSATTALLHQRRVEMSSTQEDGVCVALANQLSPSHVLPV